MMYIMVVYFTRILQAAMIIYTAATFAMSFITLG